jgi:large subunit ribosomal protein L18
MRKITGTSQKPRLCVNRTNRHIYAQVINDFDGIVIAGASSMSENIKDKKFANPKERAKEVGKLIAQKALNKNVKKVVFDRKKFKYHGNVKELADGAREGGLEF